MASVERLYILYSVIDDPKKESKHEAAFKEILTGVTAGPQERRLAAQFISRYFTKFPTQQDAAVNALFDLCEDDDVNIRKLAIKELPILCKSRAELVPKVADILAQLLQMDDAAEVATVHASLVALFKIDAKGVLTGMFYQIENSGEELVKQRCIQFLNLKLPTLGSDVITKEVEALILTEAKKMLKDASEEEFLLVMGIMKLLKSARTPMGYKQLVDMVGEQIHLDQSLDASNIENVHKVSSCVKAAIPYFSFQIPSTKFVEYLIKEVIPILDKLDAATKPTEEDQKPSTLTLDLLRTLAELLRFGAPSEDLETKVAAIFPQLLVLMPLPPDADAATKAVESGVSFEFSRVECLLYIFHKLAKDCSGFLTDNEERLKDFRARLQYFARASQAYQRRLKEELGNKDAVMDAEETKIKKIALKTTENINALIKDLFHQPPAFKATVNLSWMVAKSAPSIYGSDESASANGSTKRHAPITFDSPGSKSQKGERQIYVPPRNKFSSASGQFSGSSGKSSGNRRGGRGGWNRNFNRSRRGGFRKY